MNPLVPQLEMMLGELLGPKYVPYGIDSVSPLRSYCLVSSRWAQAMVSRLENYLIYAFCLESSARAQVFLNRWQPPNRCRLRLVRPIPPTHDT